MYMRDGKVDISLTNPGYLAPGVPGTVRGLALAHKRFGKPAVEGRRDAGGAARRRGLRRLRRRWRAA